MLRTTKTIVADDDSLRVVIFGPSQQKSPEEAYFKFTMLAPAQGFAVESFRFSNQRVKIALPG